MTQFNVSASLALAATLGLCTAGVQAQKPDYPNRPVRLVVPFPPGASIDFMARVLNERFSTRFGQTFIADNRPGAGGNIGVEFAARQTADGHTLLIGAAGAMAINISLQDKLPFDPVRDFAPISMVGNIPIIIATHPKSGIQTLADLVTIARDKPGSLAFGSAGTGTAMHLTGELLMLSAGIRLNHVPYKGSAPAAQDLIGGQIPVTITDLTAMVGQLKAGTVRGLATGGAKRTQAAPGIPTVSEAAGLKGFDAVGWFALFAPRGTPAPIIQRVNSETVAILGDPAVATRALEQAVEVQSSTPAQLAAFVNAEIAKWAKVVKASGAKAQ
jgi:tripartite-type tricarboxylate transporter receptor subunit TctC